MFLEKGSLRLDCRNKRRDNVDYVAAKRYVGGGDCLGIFLGFDAKGEREKFAAWVEAGEPSLEEMRKVVPSMFDF